MLTFFVFFGWVGASMSWRNNNCCWCGSCGVCCRR